MQDGADSLISIVSNGYGKTDFRLLIGREGDTGSEFVEIDVSIFFEGDFSNVFLKGDNSSILSTDTMRQHGLMLAHQHGYGDPNIYGARLLDSIMTSMTSAAFGSVSISEKAWIKEPGVESSSLVGLEIPFKTTVTRTSEGCLKFHASCEIQLMRVDGSSFAGFLRDKYTTQPDTMARILAGYLDASWVYSTRPVNSDNSNSEIRVLLIGKFSKVSSRSAQENLYLVASEVLNEVDYLEELALTFRSTPVAKVGLESLGVGNSDGLFSLLDAPVGVSAIALNRASVPIHKCIEQ